MAPMELAVSHIFIILLLLLFIIIIILSSLSSSPYRHKLPNIVVPLAVSYDKLGLSVLVKINRPNQELVNLIKKLLIAN